MVDLPYAEGEPPILLRKNDGSTLYATRDLAAAEDRWERFRFDRALYVVARDQSLHFAQIFRVLEAMGKPWASRCIHVAFGRMHGMSTRKAGRLVLLSDVLDEARARALEKVQRERGRGAHPHRRPGARWPSRWAWARWSSATSRTAGTPTTPSTGRRCSSSTATPARTSSTPTPAPATS